jgi:hypothetical protein
MVDRLSTALRGGRGCCVLAVCIVGEYLGTTAAFWSFDPASSDALTGPDESQRRFFNIPDSLLAWMCVREQDLRKPSEITQFATG